MEVDKKGKVILDANLLPTIEGRKWRVELHIHLDGSVRHSTLYELGLQKGLYFKDIQDVAFQTAATKRPLSLRNALSAFDTIITPLLIDDLQAIERISYEFCQDQSLQQVLYTEARFSPHLLTSQPEDKETLCKIVQTVIKGVERGEKDFAVKVRLLLCSIVGHSSWAWDVLELAKTYANWVVGIDIAGDGEGMQEPFGSEEVKVYQRAAALGIHRTAHAAEVGPAGEALFAVEQLGVERLGHGYHVISSPDIFKLCLDKGIHFETNPHSSLLTGAVGLDVVTHPIVRMAKQNASWSISRDDPTITQASLDNEYYFLFRAGLSPLQLLRSNLNGAKACFLPDGEKRDLISKLDSLYID